ncbi:oligopeptide transport system permease protein [Mycoplasma testudineum]|uniref:Oligopeptide transport system permease protein n=1 Tax=Mycoplasma testudineum TaxID=244584 RepID=A0A4R6IC42_9MOLU|nr:ABC transporter permease [Mycoplasma testudineum]OYD26534.1 peptide ABC transporter permease [Mycoplasma testudineum]TDO19127.1 oligopeptide transport system permease protein [Mycoplasma testudineum]
MALLKNSKHKNIAKTDIDSLVSEIYTPNKIATPFQYSAFKLANAIINIREVDQMGSKSQPIKEFVNRFSQNWGGVFGVIIFLFLLIAALIIPFTTADPTLLNPQTRYLTWFSGDHFLGTDSLGRDLWAQLWWGLRFSLAIAFVATILDVTIGITIGILMGYSDTFDRIFQFLIKILSNVPTIIIMILATIVFQPSFFTIVGALTINGWIGSANQIRAQVKRARSLEWVKASIVLGTPKWKILKSFIPVVVPILITQLVFSIPGAILAETSLSFIGLSLPNTATLGNLITNGANVVTLYPRYVLIPSFILVTLTTSIQLFGNATQDALRRQR